MSIIRIQNREAIPIRALPFVAGSEGFPRVSRFPPSLVILALHQACDDAGMVGTPTLCAYALKDGKPTTIDPMFLDAAAPLSDFTSEMDEPICDSFSRLPPGMFVFLDDLRAYMNWLLPPGALNGQCRDAIEIVTELKLPEALISAIYQGFDDAPKAELDNGQCSSATENGIADAEAPRLIGWRRLVIDYWPTMTKMHGGRNPTAREIIRYLREDDTGVIANPPGQSAYELNWKTARGELRTVKLHTIESAIGEFKKKGLIPP